MWAMVVGHGVERLRSIQSPRGWQAGFRPKGFAEPFQIFLSWDFAGAELCQMGRVPLGVEQGESARPQDPDEMPESDLGGVGDPMEHRFSEEGASERDAVEPPCQLPPMPDLKGMCVAAFKELPITGSDRHGDPGRLPVGACPHHFGKIRIDPDLPSRSLERPAQPVRRLKTLQGKNPPGIG